MNVVIDACCPKIIVNLSWRHHILQGSLTWARFGSNSCWLVSLQQHLCGHSQSLSISCENLGSM